MAKKNTEDAEKKKKEAEKAQREAEKAKRKEFISKTSLQAGQQITFIPTDQLTENQVAPREEVKGLSKLKKSIKNVGILEPLIVRATTPEGGQYEVISGNRRLEAAKSLNIQSVPCLVKTMEATGVMSHTFVSNTQRVALSKADQTFIVSELVDAVGNDEAAVLLCLTPKTIERIIAPPKEGEAEAKGEAVKEAMLMLDMTQTLAFVGGQRDSAIFPKKQAEAGYEITLVGVLGRGKVTEVKEAEGGYQISWSLTTG